MNEKDQEVIARIRAVCNSRLGFALAGGGIDVVPYAQIFLLLLILDKLECIDDSLACIMRNTEKD